MVECNQSEIKRAAYCYTADNSQWWAAHGEGNPRDVLARLEVADGKDYAAVQQIDENGTWRTRPSTTATTASSPGTS